MHLQCDAGSKQDTVEVRGGGTIELKRTNVFKQYCGFHPFTSKLFLGFSFIPGGLSWHS